MRFIFGITKDDESGDTMLIADNDGMPLPEVFLLLEAFLEKGKESFKDPVKNGLKF